MGDKFVCCKGLGRHVSWEIGLFIVRVLGGMFGLLVKVLISAHELWPFLLLNSLCLVYISLKMFNACGTDIKKNKKISDTDNNNVSSGSCQIF